MSEISYSAALSGVQSNWLREQLRLPRALPTMSDLMKICRRAGWSVHIYSHRTTQRVLLKPFHGVIDCIEVEWGNLGPTAGERMPEHALVIAMDRLCNIYRIEAAA